jgi:hypothetical protein
METSAGLWSALTIVAAVLIVIGVVFIAARVLMAVRMRRGRQALAEASTPRRLEEAAERGTDSRTPRG